MRYVGVLTMTCACFSATAASIRADGYSPRVGQPHADFTLPNVADREPISLSQFRGRKVLLVHYASW